MTERSSLNAASHGETSTPAEERHAVAGRPRWVGPVLGVVAVIGLLVALAFAVRISGPRELPFPVFAARAAFPELAARNRPADENSSPPRSRFEATLQQVGTAPGEPAEEPPPRRTVPLGGDLVGEIPADGGSWKWSTGSGATLVLHRPPAGRPDALVYAEAFGEKMAERPTAELHRFRTTVDPTGDGGSPFLGYLVRAMGERPPSAADSRQVPGTLVRRARIAQLLVTRTLGRGLGFVAGEEGFTGWRWVGRNQHRVAIRLARWEGTWQEQRSLPAELASAVRDALADEAPVPTPDRLARVPAYLLMGSAAEPTETSGTHLAVLCARTPDCAVAEELAAVLESIHVEPPGLLERLLREGLQEPFQELAASAGLELHAPAAGDAASETEPQKTGP